jgi:hypothetical protein
VNGAAIDTTAEATYDEDFEGHDYEQAYHDEYHEEEEWEPYPGSA